jgi:hypothetical protein
VRQRTCLRGRDRTGRGAGPPRRASAWRMPRPGAGWCAKATIVGRLPPTADHSTRVCAVRSMTIGTRRDDTQTLFTYGSGPSHSWRVQLLLAEKGLKYSPSC